MTYTSHQWDKRHGANLKLYRKALRYSQSALAKLIGRNVMTIYRWEAGITSPGAEDILALGSILKVSPNRLLKQ